VSRLTIEVAPGNDTCWSDSGLRPTEAVGALLEMFFPPHAQCLKVSCADSKSVGRWLQERGYGSINVDMSESFTPPIHDESFDAALIIEVLEHLAPDQATAEVRRVLRPGGVLLVTAPNLAYWRHRLDLALSGATTSLPHSTPGRCGACCCRRGSAWWASRGRTERSF
jgi:SAM-dependent methyltransferase